MPHFKEIVDSVVSPELRDNKIRKKVFEYSLILFDVLNPDPDVNYLINIAKALLSAKPELRVFTTFTEDAMTAKEFKEAWLKKYYALLDGIIKYKKKFLKLIERRDGVNSAMEFYYNVFTERITDLIISLREYDATDDKPTEELKTLITTINLMVYTLSYPLIAYIYRSRIDYEAITILLLALIRGRKYNLLE